MISPKGMNIQGQLFYVSLLVTAGALAFAGLVSFAAASRAGAPKPQPLRIVACTPETYEVPEGGTEGPRQSDCSRWFDGNDKVLNSDEVVKVVGQVCIDTDEPIPYKIEVAWEALTQPTRFVVLETPLTWDPGCAEPYAFNYEVPRSLRQFSPPGESVGRWRLVGRAEPVNADRWATFQWDVTGSVEIIAS